MLSDQIQNQVIAYSSKSIDRLAQILHIHEVNRAGCIKYSNLIKRYQSIDNIEISKESSQKIKGLLKKDGVAIALEKIAGEKYRMYFSINNAKQIEKALEKLASSKLSIIQRIGRAKEKASETNITSAPSKEKELAV